MMGRGALSNADHLMEIRVERRDGKKNQNEVNETKLRGLVRDPIGTDQCLILRVKITGARLNLRGYMVTGIVFPATEFLDLLLESYNVTSPPPKATEQLRRLLCLL